MDTEGDKVINQDKGARNKSREPRTNRNIRSKEVRVISDKGEQLGILSIREALMRAEDEGLDLVEVAPQNKPPVCKMMDYGKWKYQQKQQAKKAKANSTKTQVKEVKFRPKTDEHDINYKINHVLRFLGEGDKAKVTVMFRGREIAHKDRGRRILDRVIEEVKEEAVVELPPRMEGRSMITILAPRAKKK